MIKLYRLHMQKRKIIEQTVNEMSIAEEFKPLITDIVLRRALQYMLSDELLEEDLASLKANLKSIVISDQILENRESVLGLYVPDEKKIIMAPQTLKLPPEVFFQILSHEVYHALSKDRNGVDRFDRFNTILQKYSDVFEEIVVEKASYRATYPIQHDLSGFNENAYAYNDIVFVLDMIEATYGVNEQDILEHAIWGRDCLAEFLAKRDGSKKSIEDAYQFLEEIEVGASLLWSTLYPNRRAKRNPKDEEENVECALESMFNVCEDKILQRMSNTKTKNIEEAIQLKEEMAFCQYRLKNIIKTVILNLEESENYTFRDTFKKYTKTYMKDIAKRLSYMQQIILSLDFETDQEQMQTFRLAKKGKFRGSYFKKHKIDEDSFKFSVLKRYIIESEELRGYGYKWDNTYISRLCKKIIKDWEKTHKVPDVSINPDSKTEYTDKNKAEGRRNDEEQDYSR